jgi:hypothetical protein
MYAIGFDCNIAHDTFKLYNLLSRHKKEVTDKLNPDFFKSLTKIYKSRYHEDLSPGYNFVIIRNKFLAELDYSYSILENKVRFKTKSQSQNCETLYEFDRKNKHIFLYQSNYLLNNINKSFFLKSPALVYEFRMAFNHETLEARYEIPFNKEENIFIYEGLKPTNNNLSFSLSNHHTETKHLEVYRNGELMPGYIY